MLRFFSSLLVLDRRFMVLRRATSNRGGINARLFDGSSRGQALEFSRAFAERWATEAPDALGYLYIDGHVRPSASSAIAMPA